MMKRGLSTLLVRRVHKWAALLAGLQFVIWTVSGAAMALMPPEPAAQPAAAPGRWPDQVIAPHRLQQIASGSDMRGFELRPLLNSFVYVVEGAGGSRLIDAASGRLVVIDAGTALAIAEAGHGGGSATAVSRIERPTFETRKHAAPLWRVDFADGEGTSLYVAATTGAIVERRNDAWRVRDFFWMLHCMDYAARVSFNHPLIVAAAIATLWLSLSGCLLVLKTRRRTKPARRPAGGAADPAPAFPISVAEAGQGR